MAMTMGLPINYGPPVYIINENAIAKMPTLLPDRCRVERVEEDGSIVVTYEPIEPLKAIRIRHEFKVAAPEHVMSPEEFFEGVME